MNGEYTDIWKEAAVAYSAFTERQKKVITAVAILCKKQNVVRFRK
jgi:hypothetical protein